MSPDQLGNVVETALLVAGRPLTLENLLDLFGDGPELPDRGALRAALAEVERRWEGRGVELKEVAGGFRLQARSDYGPWISRLWAERPARYSRALLETLALIAYRQPITRGEIEDIRGVSVSSGIVKTLLEREWVRVLGHRDVPGRPAMYGTTREFLDYFNLKSLDELPPLAEVRDLDSVAPDLFAAAAGGVQVSAEEASGDARAPEERAPAADAADPGAAAAEPPVSPHARGDTGAEPAPAPGAGASDPDAPG